MIGHNVVADLVDVLEAQLAEGALVDVKVDSVHVKGTMNKRSAVEPLVRSCGDCVTTSAPITGSRRP